MKTSIDQMTRGAWKGPSICPSPRAQQPVTRRLALVAMAVLLGVAPLWGCRYPAPSRPGVSRDRIDRIEGRSLGEVARPRRRVLSRGRR